MADKIFTNVRLGLKVDTLENWQSSSLVLKKGEVAFCTVAASAGTGLTEPVVMMKIGDGEHTFSELGFDFYAKSSDVLAAAKTEAGLKAFVNGVIADAGIASSSAMETLAGRVTTAEGEIDTLQADLNTAETGLKARMTAAEGDITALEGLVGDKKVATQISEAITALNLANTYEAKGAAATVNTALEAYKTSNDAKILEHTNAITANTNAIAGIKDGETLDSFKDVETALVGKEEAGAAAQALADAKSYADGLADNYDEKGAAATAESNAKAYAKEYADGLAGNYDAKGDAAQALTDAKAYTDTEMTRLVGDKTVGTQISDAITALDLANTYAAKSHKHVKADITDFAHTHEIGEVNGLQNALEGKQAAGDYATKTEAQGYADAKDEAIEAAQAAADKAQEEVDALETYVGTIPEGYTETNVVAYINKKAEETLNAASGGSSESAASVLGALNTYKAENDPKVAANTEAIADLEGLVGDKKVSDAIADAVNVEKERAEGIEGGLETRLATVEGDYLKAADKTELQNQITTNANAIERLTNGVSAEEVDGVNDLIQYVKDHGTEVTGMKADIKANADAIDAIEADYLKAADKTALQDQITANDGEIAALQTAVGTKAAQSDLEALAGRVTTVEGDLNTETTGLKARMTAAEADIDALETKVGDETVSTQITNAVNELKNGQLTTMQGEIDAVEGRADALEAKAHEHANKTVLDGVSAEKVAAWDAAVQTVTAGTGLKATKTGTDVAIDFDENTTWVFDCGTSAE